ncbi:GNAT family N-acetyltransferase [Christiangramia sabulilitoris]|uniref:GNAT family N-acetyltransferase n=1 Tax=Christiangramia sabulilitoris TaxID=2583991 RepID=A0A550I696_9FLAO|nr:GNAT family N-acetyltransferase [Christiangramia sabulilitoris]TRO66489.1 GNAT family N-acetyltransferase [Christiangramia sabulilitoris]
MIKLIKTNSENGDFQELVKMLDSYLSVTDGDEHEFYDQFNKLDNLDQVVVLYKENEPVACGAIKEFGPGVMEVKRMFVKPGFRNKGYASKVLKILELWAMELGYKKCILETGLRQVEAIGLYHRNNYKVIKNYEPYSNRPNSKCFEKVLAQP